MRIVILNDGTTWTDIDGCNIATVPDDYDGDHPLTVATDVVPVDFADASAANR